MGACAWLCGIFFEYLVRELGSKMKTSFILLGSCTCNLMSFSHISCYMYFPKYMYDTFNLNWNWTCIYRGENTGCMVMVDLYSGILVQWSYAGKYEIEMTHYTIHTKGRPKFILRFLQKSLMVLDVIFLF